MLANFVKKISTVFLRNKPMTATKQSKERPATSARVPIPRDQLDSESQIQLEMLDNIDLLDTSKPLKYLRESIEFASYTFRGKFKFDGTKEEQQIPCSGYSIPITVLRPNGADGEWNNIMIYFHGGGWVWGSRETHMAFCEMICQLCSCVVVNVEYRLAPEHKFPACYEDARIAVKWCLANKKSLGGGEHSLLGVAGDSAGGNISSAVCHMVPGLDYQILIYSVFTLNPQKVHQSVLNYSDGYLLTNELMLWFRNHFFNTDADAEDVVGSPLRQKKHSHLPPALFIVAECDPLADQSAEYKDKLDSAGVKTELVMLKGVIHGFVERPGIFKETNKRTVQSVASFLSKL